MNESIRKFLAIRISSKNLDDFVRNTSNINAFLNEMVGVENILAEFDGMSRDKYNQLVSKFNALKNKYNSIKDLLTKNQEIGGRLGTIDKEIERYSKVIDFGSLVGELKNKLEGSLDIDLIIREYKELKKTYDKNSAIINKNERVLEEYNSLSKRVAFLEENRELFDEIIRELNTISVNDDNYVTALNQFASYKEKLESIEDSILLPKVDSIVEVLSKYENELAMATELIGKIQFIINRTSSEEWGSKRYLTKLREIKVAFASDYESLTINKHSFISSEICMACMEKLNEFDVRLDEIDNAIKEFRNINGAITSVRGLTTVSEVDEKLGDLRTRYNSFAYKERFPTLETDIREAEEAASELKQSIAIDAIKNVEDKVYGSSTYAVSTLRKFKKIVTDNYALLDNEHKSKVKYSQIIDRINRLIKKIKNKDLHKPQELLYILIFTLCAGLLVGFYFYIKFLGIEPLKWLFNNPPYFGHTWQHWGLLPWKWVEAMSIHDLLSFLLWVLVFLGSVICMLLCLIGECLWFLITVIAFGLAWVLLTLWSIVLHILMYAFPAVIVFFAIFFAVVIKRKYTIKSPLWLIILIVACLGLGALSYLLRFGVIVINW